MTLAPMYSHNGSAWVPTPGYGFSGGVWSILGGQGESGPHVPFTEQYVADRTSLSIASFTTAGGRRSGTFRVRHKMLRSAGDLRIMHGNFGLLADGGANPFKIALSVELLDGTIIPASYNGAHLVTVPVKGIVTTDTISVYLSAGTEFFLRTYLEVETSGMKWPTGEYRGIGSRGEGTNHYSGGADLTLGGAWDSAWNAYAIPGIVPRAIIGRSNSTTLTCFLTGDSIMAAAGDRLWDASSASFGGFGVRAALAGGYSYITASRGGGAVNTVLDPAIQAQWLSPGLVERCQIAVCNFGRNSLGGDNVSGMQGLKNDSLRFWKYLKDRGVFLAQTTTTPYTDAIDGYTTVEGQTLHNGGDAARVMWNTWLRDGAPATVSGGTFTGVATGATGAGVLRAGQAGHPLVTVFEIADLVETARNSGIWKPGYTDDGLHPIKLGHEAMVAGVKLSVLEAAWQAAQPA